VLVVLLNPLALKKPIGYGYSLVPEDVLKTKIALSELGFYKEPKSGITPWPDTPMFEGIKTFQKKKKLKVDGLMKPSGPTEKFLNTALGERSKLSQKPKSDILLAAAPAAIPAIIPLIPSIPSVIGAIAGMLGLTLPLKGDMQDKGEECEKLYYDMDIPTCNQISKKRGKEAGARCFKSAIDRFEACRRGIAKDRLPPLDTWNN